MTVPHNDLLPSFNSHLEESPTAAVRGAQIDCFVRGPEYDVFQKEFADFVGVDHCVVVACGNDALELAICAVGGGAKAPCSKTGVSQLLEAPCVPVHDCYVCCASSLIDARHSFRAGVRGGRSSVESVAVNALVIVWVSLLLFAPSMAWSLYRHSSASIFAGGAGLTLVAISGVTVTAGLLGFGSARPLKVIAILLGIVLLWVFIRGTVLFRERVGPLRVRSDWFALPLGMCLGVWVLVPPLVSLGRQGLTFGLATIGNNDLELYVLAAENTADAGFRDSNHLANQNLGAISRDGIYPGATALINFVSAATGLPAWQAALATMGVAVCLLAVALWALGKAVWPKARYAVAGAVIVACLAGLSSYTYAQFFLGGVLGLASVAMSLAGATLLARQSGSQGLVLLGAGGALGIYAYGHLGLPVLLMLPFWAVLAAALGGERGRTTLAHVATRSAAAVLVALLLSAVSLHTALNLVRSQRHVGFGWPLPVLSSPTALVWPMGIGHPTSLQNVVASWVIVLAVVVVALVAAWRRALRVSVRLASVLLSASSLVVLGAAVIYGPDRYQTWKMEAFLLPLVLVVTLPAFSASIVGTVRAGGALLAAAAGAVVLGPFITWALTLQQPTPAVMTPLGLAALAESPSLSNVSSLNIRLPSYFETMSAGAIITKSAVVFTEKSYMPDLTALHTCTLTKRAMLSPNETNFTDLGGDYVLLNRPSRCALRK
jgi:DegT/DnrJ/EryC1/StrS aminotransferase family